MNVALLCDGPVPHSHMNYRGDAFLRLLPGHGHTVYLVGMEVAGAKELRPDLTLLSYSCGRYTSIAGLRNVPLRLWQLCRMFVAVKRILRHDLDLIRTISMLPTMVALLARGRGSAPIVANVSDFYSDLYVGSKLPFARVAIWLIGHMERMCARADYLIVDTPAQRAKWVSRGAQSTRCIVIPHGLPRSWNREAGALASAGQDNQAGKLSRTLFYVGDMSEMDGLDVLLQAIHYSRVQGRPMSLLMIGNGTMTYLRELHRVVQDLGIGDVVEHRTSVRNDELPAIIERIGVCVAPFRLRETSATSIPNKVLEYLAGSKPIVVPTGSALQDIFGAAFTYFAPGDPVSLAHAIEAALATQGRASTLRSGIQRAMQWPNLIDQEWALIQSILVGQVGDARRFDFSLSERLLGEMAAQ
jgi:glycosyltransferase involved in cell wall biosynthesis